MLPVELKQIETERLNLRGWTLQDAEACYRHAKNPNVGPHAGWKPHEDVKESEKIIVEIFQPNNAWAIVDKSNETIIGCIGLEPDKRRPDISSRELGYWLAEEYWGKGIMTEAAKAVIEYAFTQMELDIVSICTSPENKRSQGVIEKCCFTYEGMLRKSYKIYDGSTRDTLCYSLLKEEWMR